MYTSGEKLASLQDAVRYEEKAIQSFGGKVCGQNLNLVCSSDLLHAAVLLMPLIGEWKCHVLSEN